MNNQNLQTAVTDLCEAIRGIMLGSVEAVVIDGAARELILSWNDHNGDDPIEEDLEMKNWTTYFDDDLG